MKHLLMITEGFPPAFAPRQGYLCKWIKQNTNWKVSVVHISKGDDSNHPATFDGLSGYADYEYEYVEGDRIHDIKLGEALLTWKSKGWSVVEFLQFICSKISYALIGRSLDFDAKRCVRVAIKNAKYDLVLCSHTASNLFRLGAYAAKLAKAPLIHDVKDIAEEHLQYKERLSWKDKLYLKGRKFYYSNASVVVVTKLLAKILKEKDSGLNPHLIYNGYDPSVFAPVKPMKSEKFIIVYVGSIYPKMSSRQLEVFFQGLVLFFKGKSPSKVAMDFYCSNQVVENILKPIIPDSVSTFCRFQNPVQQEELNVIFASASVLLLFGVQPSGKIGAIPTKLFEFLAVNRPIVEAIYDDDSEVEQILRESRAGIACDSPQCIAEFLDSKYIEWQENGFVVGDTDLNYVSQFSRYNESERYFELMQSVATSK